MNINEHWQTPSQSGQRSQDTNEGPIYKYIESSNFEIRDGEVSQWLERPTASPAMHASGVEHRCFRMGFSEKQHCFYLLNVTRRWRYWRPRRVKVEIGVSTLISRRAPHCALLTHQRQTNIDSTFCVFWDAVEMWSFRLFDIPLQSNNDT